APHVFSKHFVHAPLLEFVGQYPKWLEANRDKLSKEEYEQYEKQLELMVNLTVIYEKEPQNFSNIANIMRKIQECGMPPN
ncbi:peroxisomal biogenesis factor 19, partial [Salmonella enterica]|uniref:peroxisomal biogenesis factor 19 n=1 Tax=Salmonella enterica TaxID=28901 RepID=UPI001FAC9397